ncbi:MAG TPA: hypothetical protein VKE94_24370, partial [Gemmataceae bacterium]|nr:hypothetical protein [Gemmataceae bacterium]
DRVHGLDFSPDGRFLATASEDQTVRVWDVKTGKEVVPSRGHRAAVFSVAFSPDGNRLVSGSWYTRAGGKIWDVALPADGGK